MNISVAIMTHFDRRPHAKALKLKLDSMWFSDVTIVYDTGLGEWDTGKRTLEHGIGKSDWHIVLQDDAIIDDMFYENLYAAICTVPEKNLISLYLGKVRPFQMQVTWAFKKAMGLKASWVSAPNLYWGVGIAVPSRDIEPMILCANKHPRLLYDRRVGQYYVETRRKVFYTTTSLVDHNYLLPSLTGHDTREDKPRVAHRFSANELLEFNSRSVAL